MATQNLTISLDRATIRKARVLAARRGVSLSRLVGEVIEQMVGDDQAYQLAMREALAILDRGFDLGGGKAASRKELHDRAALR